jgi:hypothetical protein
MRSTLANPTLADAGTAICGDGICGLIKHFFLANLLFDVATIALAAIAGTGVLRLAFRWFDEPLAKSP